MSHNMNPLNKGLSTFICLCLVLTSCSLPANHTIKKESGFKTQQVTEDNSLDELPVAKDPHDVIEIVEKEIDVPIEYRIEREYPKNMPISIPDVNLTSTVRDPVIFAAQDPKELRLERKAFFKELKRLYREAHKAIRLGVVQVIKESIRSSRETHEQNLQSLPKGDAREQAKETFRQEQAARREYLKNFRKYLKDIYRYDVQNLKTFVGNKNGLNQSGSFNIQGENIGWDDVACFVFWGICALINAPSMLPSNNPNPVPPPLPMSQFEFGKFITPTVTTVVAIVFSPIWVPIAGILKEILPQPPAQITPAVPIPPATQILPAIDSNPSYGVSEAANASTTAPSSSVKELVSEAKKNPSAAMIIETHNTLRQHPELRAYFSQFRLKDMLRNLDIQVDDRYDNCVKQSATIVDFDPSTCDYALHAIAAEVLPKTSGTNGFVTQGFSVGTALTQNKQIQITAAFTGTDGNPTGDPVIWMNNLLDKKYSQYATAENKAKIKNKLQGATIAFQIVSPRTCKQDATITVMPTPGLSDLNHVGVNSTKFNVSPSLLMDGTYSFRASYTDKAGNVFKLLDDVVIEDLSKIIGKAAYQQYDQASNPTKPGTLTNFPLIMTDLLPKDEIIQTNYTPHFKMHVDNLTGNLWDLSLEKVGGLVCKPVFKAECIDSASTDYSLNPQRYTSGRYRVKTQFAFGKDENGKYFGGVNPVTGQAVPGVMLQTKQPSYDFIAINGTYSTFARLTKAPGKARMYANLRQNQTDDKTRIQDFTASQFLFEDIEGMDDSFFPQHEETPIDTTPASVPVPVAGIPGTAIFPDTFGIVRQNTTAAKNIFGFRENFNSELIQKRNLFLDLVGRHDYAPSGDFGAFRQIFVQNIQNNPFLQVGAIVDFTNPSHIMNEELFKRGSIGNDIPLLLQVVSGSKDSNSNHVIRSWEFLAKIGSHTLVETYWDGRTLTSLEDLDQPSEPEQMPNYTQGNYHVRVIIDKARMLGSSVQSRLRNNVYEKAYVNYPSLAANASKVEIYATNSQLPSGNICPPISLAHSQQIQEFKKQTNQLKTFIAQNPLPETAFSITQTDPLASKKNQIISAYNVLIAITERLGDSNLWCNLNESIEVFKVAKEASNVIFSTDVTDFISDPSFANTFHYSWWLAVNAKAMATEVVSRSFILRMQPDNFERKYNKLASIRFGIHALSMEKRIFLDKYTLPQNKEYECTIGHQGALLQEQEIARKQIIPYLNRFADLADLSISQWEKFLSDNPGQKDKPLLFMDAPLTILRNETISQALYDEYSQQVTALASKSASIQYYCDECSKLTDKDQKLICRIQKTKQKNPEDVKKLCYTMRAREFFGGVVDRPVDRVFGFSQIALDNSQELAKQRYVVAWSGPDYKQNQTRPVADADRETARKKMANYLTTRLGGRVEKEQILIGSEASTLGVTPVFNTTKLTNGEPLLSDAEIKIFETIQHQTTLPFITNGYALNVFTDRITCPYCQDVITRVDYYGVPGTLSNIKFRLSFGDGHWSDNVRWSPYFANSRGVDERMASTKVVDAINQVSPNSCPPAPKQ